jgi:hypothetical protein
MWKVAYSRGISASKPIIVPIECKSAFAEMTSLQMCRLCGVDVVAEMCRLWGDDVLLRRCAILFAVRRCGDYVFEEVQPCGCVVYEDTMTSLWMCLFCGDNVVPADVPSLQICHPCGSMSQRWYLCGLTLCACVIFTMMKPLRMCNDSFFFVNCASSFWQVCPLFQVTSSAVSSASEGIVLVLRSCCLCSSMLLSLRLDHGVSAVQSWCQNHILPWS